MAIIFHKKDKLSEELASVYAEIELTEKNFQISIY